MPILEHAPSHANRDVAGDQLPRRSFLGLLPSWLAFSPPPDRGPSPGVVEGFAAAAAAALRSMDRFRESYLAPDTKARQEASDRACRAWSEAFRRLDGAICGLTPPAPASGILDEEGLPLPWRVVKFGGNFYLSHYDKYREQDEVLIVEGARLVDLDGVGFAAPTLVPTRGPEATTPAIPRVRADGDSARRLEGLALRFAAMGEELGTIQERANAMNDAWCEHHEGVCPELPRGTPCADEECRRLWDAYGEADDAAGRLNRARHEVYHQLKLAVIDALDRAGLEPPRLATVLGLAARPMAVLVAGPHTFTLLGSFSFMDDIGYPGWGDTEVLIDP